MTESDVYMFAEIKLTNQNDELTTVTRTSINGSNCIRPNDEF